MKRKNEDKVVRSFKEVHLEDGAIIGERETRLVVTQVDAEPPFIKSYSEALAHKKINGGDSLILHHILCEMGYDNRVHIGLDLKTRIAADLNRTVRLINFSVNNLYSIGVMKRIGRGHYLINPRLFSKGPWKDILKIIKEYDAIPEPVKLRPPESEI